MLSFIRSPLQPANDRARANIAKTRIGFSSPHEDNGNRYDHNSQWHPILDMEAEDVEPLDKHVQGPLPPRSEELVAANQLYLYFQMKVPQLLSLDTAKRTVRDSLLR
jgi:hypothetical protein